MCYYQHLVKVSCLKHRQKNIYWGRKMVTCSILVLPVVCFESLSRWRMNDLQNGGILGNMFMSCQPWDVIVSSTDYRPIMPDSTNQPKTLCLAVGVVGFFVVFLFFLKLNFSICGLRADVFCLISPKNIHRNLFIVCLLSGVLLVLLVWSPFFVQKLMDSVVKK